MAVVINGSTGITTPGLTNSGSTSTVGLTNTGSTSTAGLTLSSGTLTFPNSDTQAVGPIGGSGSNQTWQNVTASRALSTTYTNSTGRPIFVIVGPAGNINQTITFTVSGVNAYSMPGSGSGIGMPAAVVVPAGATYSCTFSNGSLSLWTELR